jgi:hypothetical protein
MYVQDSKKPKERRELNHKGIAENIHISALYTVGEQASLF